MPIDGAVITVEARVVGQRKPVVAGWPVTLAAPPTDGAARATRRCACATC